MNLRKLKRFVFVTCISGGTCLMSLEVNTKGICQIEGIDYPAVGFGTYPLREEVCLKAVGQACNLGYRILDTASFMKTFILLVTL